jgi:hypothetical protein
MMDDTDTDTDASASAAVHGRAELISLYSHALTYLPHISSVPFPPAVPVKPFLYVRARLRASSPPARYILTVSIPPLNREYARQGGRRSV